jgi:hypothetical protein
MKQSHLIVTISLVLLIASCEAKDEVISANLFDESAGGSRSLNEDTIIRNGSYTVGRSIVITDTGGFGPYSNNERIVMVLMPSDASGRVTLDLFQFESELTSGTTCTEDYLNIYNGANANAARLGQWCGSYNAFFLPWRFVANNPDGALTLEWRSDNSVTFAGFYGQLSEMPSFQTYSVSDMRTATFGGAAFRAIYEASGPPALMQNHGICYSTTQSAPSRTNGAVCGTANTNRYGSISWNISSVSTTSVYFVRAFLTTPGGTILYSNSATIVPSAKVMPDFTGHSGAPYQGDVIGSDF